MLRKTAVYIPTGFLLEPLNAPQINPVFKDQFLVIKESVLIDTVGQIKTASKHAEHSRDGNNTDFDLEAEIKAHPDSVFVKCFAIKANEMNDNGDYFPRSELKIAVPTFVGVPVFTNHQNQDINQARGKVIHSWWDEERDGISIIARVDAQAYPQLARGIKDNYVTGTSMGANVRGSCCSICHNYAETQDQFCFVGTTPILMADLTSKPIANISIGDEVIDSTGSVTRVVQLFKRHVNEKLLLMKSRSICGELISTKNHPFLINSRGEYRYIPADHLQDHQVLYTPVPKVVRDNSFFDKFGFGHLSENQKKKLCRFIGYYGAKGSRVTKNNQIKALEITFHKDETEYTHDVIDICLDVFGVQPSVYTNMHTKNITRIRIWKPELCQRLYAMCPGIVHRERSKKYCREVFTLTDEYMKEILSAFIDGDGHCDINSSIVINSAAHGLASQIYYMLILCGSAPSIGTFKNGGGIYSREKKFDCYRVHIGNSQLQHLIPSGKISLAQTKTTDSSKLNSIFTEDGYVKHSLYTLDEIDFDGFVYNFETESHSYVANNTSVHNCGHIKNQKTRHVESKSQKCEYHKNGKEEKCPICGCAKGETKKFAVNQKAFEYNYGIKFIENSFVVNPACNSCGVTEVIDPSTFLSKVAHIQKVLPGLLKLANQQTGMCTDKKCLTIFSDAQKQTITDGLGLLQNTADRIANSSELSNALKTIEASAENLRKQAGQQELGKLNQALALLSEVSESMLKQRDQLDLEFLSSVVEVLASLQEVTDELTEQGYGRLPSPGDQAQAGTDMSAAPAPSAGTSPAPASSVTQTAPVNPTPGGGSKVMTGTAGPGSVTGPTASHSARLSKLAKTLNLSRKYIQTQIALDKNKTLSFGRIPLKKI